MCGVELLNISTAIVSQITYIFPFLMFILERAADSSILQGMAHSIPRLSRQLNELDSSFGLPEGPYTFEYELRARAMLEAAHAEYLAEIAPSDQRTPRPSGSTLPPINGVSGAVVGGDVVIEISGMPFVIPSGGDINTESEEQLQPE
jgi:hypothetical protein